MQSGLAQLRCERQLPRILPGAQRRGERNARESHSIAIPLQALSKISMPLRPTLLDRADGVVVKLAPGSSEVSTLVIARRLWEARFVRWRWLISER
jgi:hypothetical protein